MQKRSLRAHQRLLDREKFILEQKLEGESSESRTRLPRIGEWNVVVEDRTAHQRARSQELAPKKEKQKKRRSLSLMGNSTKPIYSLKHDRGTFFPKIVEWQLPIGLTSAQTRSGYATDSQGQLRMSTKSLRELSSLLSCKTDLLSIEPAVRQYSFQAIPTFGLHSPMNIS